MPLSAKIEERIKFIAEEYERSTVPWFIGFSGGKDSSAVLKLVYAAIRRKLDNLKPVSIIYCDTGVEIPPVVEFVRHSLRAIEDEAKHDGMPLCVRVARPPVSDSFFVKVIGRGYPTPTNKFRWCTKRLRVNPVRRVLQETGSPASTVLLGTRTGESAQRDRTLQRLHTGKRLFYRQVGSRGVSIFAPIEDFSVGDVWSTLFALRSPRGLDVAVLSRLYRDAGSECPIVRDPQGTPCGAGRFGCWTCTVVRKDRAVTNMVAEGHDSLEPLLEFRNWLSRVRDDRTYRARWRRNGARGLGPFTLAARREILRRLRRVQGRVPWGLIAESEIREIHRLWREDQSSSSYRE